MTKRIGPFLFLWGLYLRDVGISMYGIGVGKGFYGMFRTYDFPGGLKCQN